MSFEVGSEIVKSAWQSNWTLCLEYFILLSEFLQDSSQRVRLIYTVYIHILKKWMADMHNSKCWMRYCCSGSVGSLCRCSPHTKSCINIQMEDYQLCVSLQRRLWLHTERQSSAGKRTAEFTFEDSHWSHNFLFLPFNMCTQWDTERNADLLVILHTLWWMAVSVMAVGFSDCL